MPKFLLLGPRYVLKKKDATDGLGQPLKSESWKICNAIITDEVFTALLIPYDEDFEGASEVHLITSPEYFDETFEIADEVKQSLELT